MSFTLGWRGATAAGDRRPRRPASRPSTPSWPCWPRAVAFAAALLAAALPGATGAAPPNAGGLPAEVLSSPGAFHVHRTEHGDTLIGLGRRFLVDPRRWREIARVNGVRDVHRIPTGAELRIPLALMRSEAVPSTLIFVGGRASVDGQPLDAGRVGQPLPEGATLETGEDGQLGVRLVDGTTLRLRPGSRLQLSTSRRMPQSGAVRAGARLERGRVDVESPPGGRPGFEIGTPNGLLGVRGTAFRVAGDEQGTRGEVVEGVVAVAGRGGGIARVGAGFGTVIDAAGAVAPARPLLPAPVLAGLPLLHEQPLLRFALPALPGALAWRAQVARREAPQLVVADLRADGGELRIAELPDGDYLLRLRGIDSRGLEGLDGEHAFRLKARPEPPLPAEPAPRTRVFGERVEFRWAPNPQAARVRLQLAPAGGDFAAPLQDLRELAGASAVVGGLAPGRYAWRLASVHADGDQGPWQGAQEFELRAPPPALPPPALGDGRVRLAWQGLPGQRYELQVARDAAFSELLLERRSEQPEAVLEWDQPGDFFVRVRATEADGFVGPWGAGRSFEWPDCVRAAGGCVRAAGAPLRRVR
ncbi:MAG: FecR domain-containing protein [Burkholderiales bacterium]|nr:FecR domain-containing protein [Burkholderiales bacterium]